jgi:hypothetical protein
VEGSALAPPPRHSLPLLLLLQLPRPQPLRVRSSKEGPPFPNPTGNPTANCTTKRIANVAQAEPCPAWVPDQEGNDIGRLRIVRRRGEGVDASTSKLSYPARHLSAVRTGTVSPGSAPSYLKLTKTRGYEARNSSFGPKTDKSSTTSPILSSAIALVPGSVPREST